MNKVCASCYSVIFCLRGERNDRKLYHTPERGRGLGDAAIPFPRRFEILLSLTDCGYFWVDDRSYELRARSLILLEGGMLHRSIVPEGVVHQRYVVHFLPAYAAALSSRRTNLLSCFTASTASASSRKPSRRRSSGI
jgi:hypothetical protein